MPYWKCPRCGSHDAYLATVLHEKATGGGGSFIGQELGDTGIRPMLHKAARSETVEHSVPKCKECGELLGKKDYHYTAAEVEEQKEKQKREKEASERVAGRVSEIVALVIIAAFIFGLVWFLASSLTAKQYLPDFVRYVAIWLVGLFGFLGLIQPFIRASGRKSERVDVIVGSVIIAVFIFGLVWFLASSLTAKQFLPDLVRYVAIYFLGIFSIILISSAIYSFIRPR